jgi:hypothetical protein
MLNYQRIIQWDKREKSRDEKKIWGKLMIRMMSPSRESYP